MNDIALIQKALDSGCSYLPATRERGTLYVFSLNELKNFAEMLKPEQITDAEIADLWHQSGEHLYKFAKTLRDYLCQLKNTQ